MIKSLSKNRQGIAQMAVIVGLVVIVAVGGVAYYVLSKDKKDSGGSSGSSSIVADSEAEKVCNNLYKDKDLCKFVSRYNGKGPYKVTFVNTDKAGKASTTTMEIDGNDNSSMVIKDGNTEVSAFISLNGDTYVKDVSDGSWTKYPKNQNTPQADNPTTDLKVEIKDEEAKPEAQRTSYKKLGKEKVGGVDCFKYQVSDPADPTAESTVWFDDKDFQLRKWSFKDKEGATSVAEFSYVSVTIKEPSPVKAAPAVPNQADLQNYLNQAQQQAGQE